jgi:hypothetical protein
VGGRSLGDFFHADEMDYIAATDEETTWVTARSIVYNSVLSLEEGLDGSSTRLMKIYLLSLNRFVASTLDSF